MQEEEDLCKLLISYIDITELHQTLKLKGAKSHSFFFLFKFEDHIYQINVDFRKML